MSPGANTGKYHQDPVYKVTVYRREKVNEESIIMVVDLIRIFRVLQISKLIRHLTEFQLLVKSGKFFLDYSVIFYQV